MELTLKYLKRKFNHLTVRRYMKRLARKKIGVIQKFNDREKLVYGIVKGALSDRRNTLSLAPISGTKYIKMPVAEMFIILGDNNIIISNHKFYYDIDLNPEINFMLHDRFNRLLEHQRALMEREMKFNIIDGLSHIAESVNNTENYGN